MADEKKKERPKKPPLRARIRARWPEMRAIYFSFDPRSLGLARIGLGLLLLYDLWRRVGGIATWYSNEGLLPNHAVLWRPDSDYLFSFFFAASTAAEAAVLFVLVALVYLCFLVGWRTRLFHLLSLACLVSVHSRGTFLENGGDVALNLLCGWTLFFPMGARFSLDAVRASLEEKRERSVAELADRDAWRARAKRPVVSLAVLAILLQLSVMYYFNAVHKHGWTWREGKAIHYVLYQERMVTWFGLLVRRHMTLPLSMIMTYATLIIEIAAPLLLLNPVQRYRTRSIAILVYPALHLAFAAFLNLGQFSFNMIGYFPLLLSLADWQLINLFVAPPESRRRTVVFDISSPLLAGFARLLARLDAFDRMKFEALAKSTLPEDDTKRTAPARFAVVNPLTNERTTGLEAITECCGALAFGRPLAWLLHTGVGRKLGQWALRWIARREHAIESTVGLEAMTAEDALPTAAASEPITVPRDALQVPRDAPQAPLESALPAEQALSEPAPSAEGEVRGEREVAAAAPAAPAPSTAIPTARIPRYDEPDQGPPVRRWFRRRATQVRELTLAVLIVVVASQVLMENKAVPAQLKWGQPKWMQQILSYPRMFQGWGMFSSDVPLGERMLYVDAVTFGGRHVDPFNEAGSRVATLPVERIPAHMEQDEFWCDYTNRIPERQVYWRMLREWIMAYHLRTMKREDRIISFEAKLLESDSPPPGEFEARNFRTKVMMTDRDQ